MSERIVAVIPIRSLRNGKTRLAAVLSAEERAALLRATAEGAITAARAAPSVANVLVVSRDPEVLAWAGGVGQGVVPLAQQDDRPGLNGAIDAGRAWALDDGADAIFSLFGDLPLVARGDLDAMMAEAQPVVLGADRRGEGTNALLLRLGGPGAAFRFAFGEGSLCKHMAEARRLGLDVAIHESAGVGFDLDTPADWADYRLLRAEGGMAAHELMPVACGAGAE